MAILITFLYHEVCESPQDSGFQRRGALPYKHTPDQFINDLEIISKFHSKPGLCAELIKSKKHSLMMTFDDGGMSALKSAEILEKRGWRGHFFITTSMIGKAGFLASSDIARLSEQGHIVGSHSHTHPDPFRSLSPEKQLEEWKISRDILEQIINKKVTSASVPGGEMNWSTIKSAQLAGFQHLFTSEPHLHVIQHERLRVYGRFCPKKSTSHELIARWAQGRGIKRLKCIRFLKAVAKRTFLYRLNSKFNSNPIN